MRILCSEDIQCSYRSISRIHTKLPVMRNRTSTLISAYLHCTWFVHESYACLQWKTTMWRGQWDTNRPHFRFPHLRGINGIPSEFGGRKCDICQKIRYMLWSMYTFVQRRCNVLVLGWWAWASPTHTCITSTLVHSCLCHATHVYHHTVWRVCTDIGSQMWWD